MDTNLLGPDIWVGFVIGVSCFSAVMIMRSLASTRSKVFLNINKERTDIASVPERLSSGDKSLVDLEPGEPVWLLRGSDRDAPKALRHLIQNKVGGVGQSALVRNAQSVANDMDKYYRDTRVLMGPQHVPASGDRPKSTMKSKIWHLNKVQERIGAHI